MAASLMEKLFFFFVCLFVCFEQVLGPAHSAKTTIWFADHDITVVIGQSSPLRK